MNKQYPPVGSVNKFGNERYFINDKGQWVDYRTLDIVEVPYYFTADETRVYCPASRGYCREDCRHGYHDELGCFHCKKN